MNQSQIDLLFQITTPLPERGSPTIARGDGQLPDFGNHLVEATTTAPSKLPSATDYRPADYRPEFGPTDVEDANCRPEQTGNDETPASPADDSIEDAPTDEATNTNTSAPAEQCESDSCEPGPDADSETQNSASEDDAPDSDAEETASIVAVVAPPVGTVVSGQLVVGGENAAADSTTQVASEPAPTADGNQTPSDVALLSPTSKRHATDIVALSPPLHSDQTNASVVTIAGTDDVSWIPGMNKSDDNHATSAVDKKTRKAERTAKRVAAADGDEATRKVDSASGDSKQLAEAVAAKIEAADGSAKEASTDTVETDSTANRTTSTRNTSDSSKGVVTAAANGVVAQSAGPSPQSDAAEDSRGKTSKVSGPAKNEALIAAARSTRTSIAPRRGAKATAESDEAPRVDPARFVGRVAKAVQTAHERGSTLQLRLSPPELGAVKLALTVKDGVMTAALETETAIARRLLLDHLPALRERLASQNIRIERFDVDVQRDGTGGRPDSHASHQQQQQQHQSHNHSPPRPQARTTHPVTSPVPEGPLGSHAVLSNSGINVVA